MLVGLRFPINCEKQPEFSNAGLVTVLRPAAPAEFQPWAASARLWDEPALRRDSGRL
jgi:hypothetical protein